MHQPKSRDFDSINEVIPEIGDIPQFVDKKLLSPLLKEYDSMVDELKIQVQSYQKQIQELSDHIKELCQQNALLMTKVKQFSKNESESSFLNDDNDDLTSTYSEDFDNKTQKNKKSSNNDQTFVDTEIDRLQKIISNLNTGLFVQDTSQADNILKEKNQNINKLHEELLKFREEITNFNNFKISQDQNKYVSKQEDKENFEGSWSNHRKENLLDLLFQYENILLNNKDQYQDQDSLAFAKYKSLIRARIEEFQENERKILKQAKTYQKLVEDAFSQKEQHLIREKQALEECDRLREIMTSLVDKAGERTRQEVDEIKELFNCKLTKNNKRIQELELMNSEKNAELEKIIKDKKKLEIELERLIQDDNRITLKESGDLNDLTSRIFNAERSRDEANMKLENMNIHMRRIQVSHEQEKSCFESELNSINVILERTQKEIEQISYEKSLLLQELEDMKNTLSSNKIEKDYACRNAAKQLMLTQQLMEQKKKEYGVSLQTLQEEHKNSLVSLKQMVSSQQRLANKLKDESAIVKLKLESQLSQIKDDLSKEKSHKEEILKLLKISRDKNLEIEGKLYQFNKDIKLLENQMENSYECTCTTHKCPRMINMDSTKKPSAIENRKLLKKNLERNFKEFNSS